MAAATRAVVTPDVAARRRLAIAALALPTLLAVPILIWAILTLAPLAD
jgi:hypothetical protein